MTRWGDMYYWSYSVGGSLKFTQQAAALHACIVSRLVGNVCALLRCVDIQVCVAPLHSSWGRNRLYPLPLGFIMCFCVWWWSKETHYWLRLSMTFSWKYSPSMFWKKMYISGNRKILFLENSWCHLGPCNLFLLTEKVHVLLKCYF